MPEYVFETTLEMACWKRHTCVACGCVYQYQLVAEGVGSADARSFSSAQAEKSAMRKLELEMEPHPCPTCGVYQPDMIAGPRQSGHNWLFAAVLVVVFPAALIALFGFFPSYLVGVAVGILATLAAVGQIAVALQNPNADLAGNKALAQAEMKVGDLQLIQPGNTDASQPAPGRPRFGLGLLLVTLAGPALLAPVLIALAFGLSQQSDIRPQYVGAGDRLIITLPRENVASINGAWKGKASAVLIAPDHSPTALEAVAGQERYGRIILNDRSAPTVSPCQLFAHVQLPDDADLDGKTVQIRLSMDVSYPLPKGRRQFVEKTTTVTRDVEMQVADRLPLRLYNGFGIIALVVGWGGMVVGSGVLVFQAWREHAQSEGGLVIPVEPDE